MPTCLLLGVKEQASLDTDLKIVVQVAALSFHTCIKLFSRAKLSQDDLIAVKGMPSFICKMNTLIKDKVPILKENAGTNAITLVQKRFSVPM